MALTYDNELLGYTFGEGFPFSAEVRRTFGPATRRVIEDDEAR